MAWNPLDEPIDYVEVEGRKTPGIAFLEKAGILVKWDKVNGYGYGGAMSRFTGLDLSPFNIRVQLWDRQDWEDWDAFKDVVAKPPRMVRPRAKDVWHPFLEMVGIRSATITEVSQPVPIEDGTVYELTIRCLEYRKPIPMYGQPDGANAKSDDPVDKVIENLTNQLDALANG